MSTLFDISPEEPVKKRGARAKGRGPSAPEAESEKTPLLYREIAPNAEIIGKIDDRFVCADSACGASSHDIVGEDLAEWAIECAACGTMQRVRAIKGFLRPKEQEFAFEEGRFAGQTISQVWADNRGREYLQWAAESHRRQSVRDSVRSWLARNQEGK